MPKTTDKRMRNNSGELEECSEREVNRGGNGEKLKKRGNTDRGMHVSFPAVFHMEPRTEALLCWQPQGANTTPGREKEKGDHRERSETPGGYWTK